MTTQAPGPTPSERLDAAEEQMLQELDVPHRQVAPVRDGRVGPQPPRLRVRHGRFLQPPRLALQVDDPRLQKMPDKPTLLDFFKYRFGPSSHLLQSAKHALERRPRRRDRPRLPPARHRRHRLHPQRPRLLGRPAHRALRRREGGLGHPRPPGPALLRRRVRRLRVPRDVHPRSSARTSSRSRTSRRSTSGSRTTSGT